MSENSSDKKSAKKIFTRSRVVLILAAVIGLYYCYNYYICDNFKTVISGEIYRSAQPSSAHLNEWIDKYGLKSVVNLRGWNTDMAKTEEAICEEKGIDFYTVELSAYENMPSQKLIELLDILEQAEQPVLLHCRQGIDRSGTASGLAAWLLGYESYGVAKWHAYVLPGPWKYKKGFMHISDIFSDYEEYCSEKSLDRENTDNFNSWARNVYKPRYYNVHIDAPAIITAEPGEMLSINVSITNLSEEVIPAGNSSNDIDVYSCYLLNGQMNDIERTSLVHHDVKPGGKTDVVHIMSAPKEPGQYKFMIDMVDNISIFSKKGSDYFEGVLVVKSPESESEYLSTTENEKCVMLN